MTSINGFKIKNIVDFMGKEGPCKQGDLYYRNKKVLFWSDDMNGGEMWFEWENSADRQTITEKTEQLIEVLFRHDPVLSDSELLINYLLSLSDMEKEWKQNGKEPILFIWNCFAWRGYPLKLNDYMKTKVPALTIIENMEDSIAPLQDDFESSFGKAKTSIFRCADDFNVCVLVPQPSRA